MPSIALARMWAALQTRTGRDTQLVFAGQILGAGFGFLANIILIRTLSVEDYGLFSLFMSAMMLISGFMHLGWLETFVRFGAKHLQSPFFAALRRLFLQKTLIAALLVGGACFLLSGTISTKFYHRPEFASYFQLAIVGGLLTCLFTYFQNDFRIQQNFQPYFTGQVGPTLARMLCFATLASLGSLTLSQTVSIHLLMLFLAVAYSLMTAPALFKTGTQSAHVPGELRRELSQYNVWIMVSFLTTHIQSNIDSHFLAHYHSDQALSAFGVAGKLTLPILFLVTSMTTTLLPRLSASNGAEDIRKYISVLKLFMLPAIASVLAMLWLAPPVLIWIAGDKYQTIGPTLRFQILYVLVILMTNPVGLILLAWGFSRALAAINTLQLFIGLGFNFLLIPKWGATGAAASGVVTQFCCMLVIYALVLNELRKQKN